MCYTNTIAIDDIEMKYACFGRGTKTFVILPGLSIKSVADAAEAVEKAYRSLEEEYTIYLFDRRSNAKSGYTIKDMADDTTAVMKKLGIKNADIFGASQGGMIAMYMAVYHPEVVGQMVLGSTTARLDDGFRMVYQKWIELAQGKDKQGLAEYFADTLYSSNTLDTLKDTIIANLSDCSDSELDYFVTLAKALDTLSIYDELSKIKSKVLVIGSEGDKVVGAATQREIAEVLGCELYMYGSEYGHAVYDEAPDYLDRMVAFFKQHKK